MKIKVLQAPFCGEDYPIEVDEILNKVECPIENAHLCLENDNSIWVELSNKKVIRLFNNEYMIESFESEKEEREYANILAGVNITKQVRKLYVTGEHKKAFEILDSILTSNDTLTPKQVKEVRYKILLGNAFLNSDGNNNFFLVEEENKVYKHYLTKVMSQYFNYNNKLYVPIYFVPDYGYLDRYNNVDFGIDEDNKLSKRASFYCTNKTNIISMCKYDDLEMNIIFKKVILDTKLKEFASKTSQESLDNWVKSNPNAYLDNKGFEAYLFNNDMSFEKPDIISPYQLREEEKLEEQRREERKQEISSCSRN